MQTRFLQRMLIGDRVTCPFCHTGHIKVYGVTAVLRDSVPLSQESLEPSKRKAYGARTSKTTLL